MEYLSVSNLDQFQHYKKKNPLWIKFYRTFWTDHTLLQLRPLERLLFLGFCTLASELENKVPHDIKYLSSRLHLNVTEKMLQTLLSSSLLCLFSSLTYTKTRETLEPVYKVPSGTLENIQRQGFTQLKETLTQTAVRTIADKWLPPQ